VSVSVSVSVNVLGRGVGYRSAGSVNWIYALRRGGVFPSPFEDWGPLVGA